MWDLSQEQRVKLRTISGRVQVIREAVTAEQPVDAREAIALLFETFNLTHTLSDRLKHLAHAHQLMSQQVNMLEADYYRESKEPLCEEPGPGISTCHAVNRLHERYDVQLKPKGFRNLTNALSSASAAGKPNAYFQLVLTEPSGVELWRVNLQPVIGRMVWALAVFDPQAKRILTFKPPVHVLLNQRIAVRAEG